MQSTVKYTTVLPSDFVDELKQMAARQQIPSINQGIRDAVERYLEQERKAAYQREMQAAAQDDDFLARTMGTHQEFSPIDQEEMDAW